VRDTEANFARELLAAAREHRAPNPEAQAYQDELDTLDAVRPFHKIEGVVHGLIDSLAAGHTTGEDARAHFDRMMELYTETHFEKQRLEQAKRKTR
jgi:hypothetical protein